MNHLLPPRTPALLAVFLITCTASPVLAATHDVTVQNFTFTPKNLNILQGDVVRWNWVEGMHTTTNGSSPSAPGAGTIWNAPLDISNTTFQRTFNTPGSFPYHCGFHWLGGMTGTITVSDGNTAPVVTNPGTQQGVEEVFFSVVITATDGEGDPLTMSDNGTTPSWASFVDNGNGTATLSGTPALGEAATYPITVTASDGALSDSESFDIVIGPAPIEFVDLTSTGFVPQNVVIDVGFQVRWTKLAGGNHTTTNGTGPGDPGAGTVWDAELRASSPEFTFTFDTPGTYPYFCANHPTGETGSVTVNDTTVVGVPDPGSLPVQRFIARPNPFHASVLLSFDLEASEVVRIEVFEVSGRLVRTLHAGNLAAGRQEISWDGNGDDGNALPGGVYFVRFDVGERTGASKLLKIR